MSWAARAGCRFEDSSSWESAINLRMAWKFRRSGSLTAASRSSRSTIIPELSRNLDWSFSGGDSRSRRKVSSVHDTSPSPAFWSDRRRFL
jgi:hypothetical protein